MNNEEMFSDIVEGEFEKDSPLYWLKKIKDNYANLEIELDRGRVKPRLKIDFYGHKFIITTTCNNDFKINSEYTSDDLMKNSNYSKYSLVNSSNGLVGKLKNLVFLNVKYLYEVEKERKYIEDIRIKYSQYKDFCMTYSKFYWRNFDSNRYIKRTVTFENKKFIIIITDRSFDDKEFVDSAIESIRVLTPLNMDEFTLKQ